MQEIIEKVLIPLNRVICIEYKVGGQDLINYKS